MIEEFTKENNLQMSDGFLRQRRNLVLSSFFLFIFITLGFELEQIKLLGNTARITNSANIPIILFVIQLYFMLRYWQYYLEESSRPLALKEIGKNIMNLELKFFDNEVFKNWDKLGFPHRYEAIYPRYSHDNNRSKDILEINIDDEKGAFFRRYCFVFIHISNSEIPCFDEKVLGNEGWEVINDPHKEKSRSGKFFKGKVSYNSLRLLYFRISGFLKYIFIQPFFTDYELPIILSCLSLSTSLIFFFDFL